MALKCWNKSDSDSYFCEYSVLDFTGSEFDSLSETEYEDKEQFQQNIYKLQQNIYKLQQEKLKLFQSQNPEIGHFDVVFDFNGKLLYANKYVLVTSSETLDAWLSDRWTKDENPIKIETYTFDIFYQFCSFLYSGNCKLTKENIFQIVDAAEFFGIPVLKNHCETFIKEKRQKLVNEENFFEVVKIAEKYSLLEFTKYLDYRLHTKFEFLIDKNEMNFLGLSKSRIIALCKNQKEGRFKKMFFKNYENLEEAFFKTIYKWVENYVQTRKEESNDENFDYENAMINEFYEILPFFQFSRFGFDSLMEFAVKHGFLFYVSSDLYKILAECKRSSDQEQKLFKTMYEVAEKKVLEKQKNYYIETINENDAIKKELSEFLPKIKFYLMDKKFLKDSVVAKGIISHYQAFEVITVKVEITNEKRTLNGIFEDNLNISNAVGKNSVEIFSYNELKQRFIRFKFPRPSTPSRLIKKNGIQWYLCLEWDGILAAKHQSLITETDYLIAELNYIGYDFRITKNTNAYIKITRF